MLKKNFGIVLKLSLCLFASACATMPPDIPVCVEFNYEHGRCVKIISGESFDWDDNNKYEGETWWNYRYKMVLIPINSWSKLKSYIIKSCKKYGNCEKEINSWNTTLDKIDENLKKTEPY